MLSDTLLTRLPLAEWLEKSRTHLVRAEHYTRATRERRDRGLPHPVEDFLFQYYPYPISLLENWQPGVGVGLEWPESPTPEVKFSLRYYTQADGILFADVEKLTEKERERLRWIHDLLVATAGRAGNFACHGLHEWAMVYKGKQVRHEKTTPLRLPQAEIDGLVESRAICCSHHDAFRFFAQEARPMNRLQPSLERREELEQPGCVHANMDLYKWAAKAMPWAGSTLLLDTFELSLKLRELDMRASPYDLSGWGHGALKIETAEGRKQYEVEQRELAGMAAVLRQRLIDQIGKVL